AQDGSGGAAGRARDPVVDRHRELVTDVEVAGPFVLVVRTVGVRTLRGRGRARTIGRLAQRVGEPEVQVAARDPGPQGEAVVVRLVDGLRVVDLGEAGQDAVETAVEQVPVVAVDVPARVLVVAARADVVR